MVEPIDLDKVLKKLKELEKAPRDVVIPANYDIYLRSTVICLAYATIALSRRQEKLQKGILALTVVLVVLTLVEIVKLFI